MWDYIVVGAGSAGCVVANRLSESGDKRVLLLEAGPRDRSVAITVPGAAWLLGIARFDWGYRSIADATRNQRSEAWMQGRVLGGSSSINGMNYVRGSAADFDRWLSMGNDGWGANSVMPVFQDLERCDQASIFDPQGRRGWHGPVHVRSVRACHPITEAFIRSAQAVGYRFNDDYNGLTQEGVGYTQLTQRRGRRWSAADAFLKPALSRKNLTVLTDSLACRLLIANRRATGIEYQRDRRRYEAQAHRLILCGGAINTPKLLMLSGIGDAQELFAQGIDVVLDRKSVGRGLLEHPLLRLVYRTNAPTYNPTGGLRQKVQFLAKYLLRGQGPIASVFEGMAFLKTSPQTPEPDIQVHFAPVGFSENEAAKPVVQVADYPSITAFLNVSRPLSRGRVRLRSEDPTAPPIIEPRLLAEHEDVAALIRGIGAVRRIMSAAPVANLIEEEVRPGSSYSTPDSLMDYVRPNTTVAYHPAGTCRMGVDDTAVVTPDLKVRGIENLWIADASVLPDLISGNTNAVCMMIGEKLARLLLRNS